MAQVTDRLLFLAEQFDVFDCSKAEIEKTLSKKLKALEKEGYGSTPVTTHEGDVIAIASTKVNEKNRQFKKVSLCSDIFTNMIKADPTDNKLKTLPKEIGMLKNLEFINLTGNPLKDIPDEISNLDVSNGGSLYRLGIKEEDIGVELFQKLQRLLPTTELS